MAITIISREFDPHLAAEKVVLENSLGVRHYLTLHIGDHEGCPACGRPANKKAGVVDIEQAIQDAITEWTEHEKKLLKHMRTRKKK